MTTPTTTMFGLDVWSGEDVDPARTASELELVAQDTSWRIRTPRGAGILAIDSPDYGIDILDMIGSASTAADAAALPGRIRAELTKDDRILDAVVTVTSTVDGPSTSWTITIVCQTNLGPFTLVLSVNDVTVELLSISTGDTQ